MAVLLGGSEGAHGVGGDVYQPCQEWGDEEYSDDVGEEEDEVYILPSEQVR